MKQGSSIPFVLASLIFILCGCFATKEFLLPISFLWKIALIPSKVQKLELWRIFISPFFHTNIVHLALNVIVLLQIGVNLENNLGHFGFLLHTTILIILCGAFYTFAALLTTLFDFFKTFNSPIIGMSSIVLALSGIDVYITEQKYRSMFYIFHVPVRIYPFCVATAFLIALPDCSVLSLACGLLIGNIYSWLQFKRVPKKADIKREKSNHYMTNMCAERDQSVDSIQSSPFALFTLSWLDKERRFVVPDKI